jgi:hypothetical protein
MSNADFRPLTSSYIVWQQDWAAFHQVVDALEPASPPAHLLGATLDAIEARSRERFALGVWEFDDIRGTVARALGYDVDYNEELPVGVPGLTAAQLEEIAVLAHESVLEAMIPGGWDALEYCVMDWLDDHGSELLRADTGSADATGEN